MKRTRERKVPTGAVDGVVDQVTGSCTIIASNGYRVRLAGDRTTLGKAGEPRVEAEVDRGDQRIVDIVICRQPPARLAMLAFEAGLRAARNDSIRRRHRRRKRRLKSVKNVIAEKNGVVEEATR